MLNKRRLLFLIESLAGGGAEKVLVTLLKHLDPIRFDITLCSVNRVGKYLDDIPSCIDVRFLLPDPASLKGLALLFYKIKYKLIYKLPPGWTYCLFIPKGRDVEIAFIEGSATRIIAGSANKKAKKIAWVHTDLARNRGVDVNEESYYAFDRIVTVSHSAQLSFEAVFPKLSSRLVSIYNLVDRDSILIKAAETGESNSRDSSVIRLVSVGRLCPIKAYDRLLRVFLRIYEHCPNLELWILGEGGERHKLLNFIQANGLSDSVKLLGFVDNPYRLMSQCDLFVCSSVAEGFSTAATEALILGLPVVTTDCSGMEELLGKEECGLIVDNDEEALYKGLDAILMNPGRIEKMKISARKRGEHFSMDRLMPPILAILE